MSIDKLLSKPSDCFISAAGLLLTELLSTNDREIIKCCREACYNLTSGIDNFCL